LREQAVGVPAELASMSGLAPADLAALRDTLAALAATLTTPPPEGTIQ
jgi:hypothetical protein